MQEATEAHPWVTCLNGFLTQAGSAQVWRPTKGIIPALRGRYRPRGWICRPDPVSSLFRFGSGLVSFWFLPQVRGGGNQNEMRTRPTRNRIQPGNPAPRPVPARKGSDNAATAKEQDAAKVGPWVMQVLPVGADLQFLLLQQRAMPISP